MTGSTSAPVGNRVAIAVIGFSNIACRTAVRLAESGSSVLFIVCDSDRSDAELQTNGVELLSLPCLRPNALSPVIENCLTAVVASDDEQFNLHVTLQLSSDYPELRIVTRLFNLGLGREIEVRLSRVTVLSVSERAAPFFAAAAFFDHAEVAWHENDRLMVRSRDGVSETTVMADSSRTSRPGNAARRRISPRIKPDLMLLAVLTGIAFVIASGTLFFWLRLGIPPGDALYFVVTTLTTTGYGDYSLREYPFFAKIAGMVLMLSGASLFAILFALVTDKLFRVRLDILMGRRPVRATGHVIVCGAGDVGIRVVESLQLTGTEIVVVERDQDGRFNQRIREMGIPLIIDDATLPETLERASVQSASAIICATDNDMCNLEVALNASSNNPAIRTVVRVYDRDFAEQTQHNFRINVALSSSAIASRAFAAAALGEAINAEKGPVA